MALNFPNSPTDGQIYSDTQTGNRWVWDNANTCWKSTSTYAQTVTVSSTQPGTPTVGQLWWSQDYGRLFVYYNDGDSTQWVEANPADQTAGLVFNTANAAYGRANTALQNTTGTFAGNLTITGTANINGTLYVSNITQANTYTISYLIVAGGGGGGSSICGGGGGGGVIVGTANVVIGSTFSATIGAGGAAGSQGGNTIFGNFTTAIGGGSSPGYGGAGYDGGSGGGGARSSGPGGLFQVGGNSIWPQGFPGGNGSNTGGSDNYGSGGGGGGAGGPGQDAQGAYAGNGGKGIRWINSGLYAGGGGGSAYNGNGGQGGSGTGGAGTGSNSTGGAGVANSGGGGGSGGYSGGVGATGGAGGSGVVIIGYPGSQRGTGGNSISSYNGWTFHYFTSSGTFTA